MASTVLNTVRTTTPQTPHKHTHTTTFGEFHPNMLNALLLILPLNSESDRHSSSNQTKFGWLDGWLGFNGILSTQVAAISCLRKFKVC